MENLIVEEVKKELNWGEKIILNCMKNICKYYKKDYNNIVKFIKQNNN